MTQNTCSTVKHRIGRNAVERFDESEVQEIKIDDRDYPELLKEIKKPPKILRICGNLPPSRKIIAISGSRETTQPEKSLLREGQSFLNILITTQRYSTGTFYAEMKLSLDCPKRRSLSQRKRDRARLLPRTAL